MMFIAESASLQAARAFDEKDPFSRFRREFVFPKTQTGEDQLYFAGHSLGLMPVRARHYAMEEFDSWGRYGVEGHFLGEHPWYSYHEFLTEPSARLVGARPDEVVVMNSLTVNLHLMMVSFYRPSKERFKILIEKNTFPSDQYAVDSQARFHGFDPKQAIVEVEHDRIIETISELGSSLALVMLGNCNYLTGYKFDMKAIASAAHDVGALAGFNLAHGAGNLGLSLHDDGVDFAVWCSYKYLNSGPGGLAGCFVHQRHLNKKDIPRFEGWWGTDKSKRFQMSRQFQAMPTVEAWQLSNPPILPMATLRASLEIFDEAGMWALRERGDRLTTYLEYLLKTECAGACEIVTPENRGSMLCVRIKGEPKTLAKKLSEAGVIVDFREPDILRMAPAPLYNSFEDVYRLVDAINGGLNG
ncbi:MAG: kynureninase [Pseudobdellovibrionaceae bacterium]|nr:kynureninase [Bdellovibrionales bacterium]USN48688.1 MAG: kynureninase [Pseudobdellovibrionaceae bacterium]